MAIVADRARRDELLGLHAPFSLHGTTGDTSGEELLAQGGFATQSTARRGGDAHEVARRAPGRARGG